MTSAINPLIPVEGVPALKSDFRDNFAAAKAEIEALQALTGADGSDGSSQQFRELSGLRNSYDVGGGATTLTSVHPTLELFGTAAGSFTLVMPDGTTADEVVTLVSTATYGDETVALRDTGGTIIVGSLAGNVIYGLRWRGTGFLPHWSLAGVTPRTLGSNDQFVSGLGILRPISDLPGGGGGGGIEDLPLALGVRFLTPSQNTTIDVADIATAEVAHIKTGSGWDGSYTLTFAGLPVHGQEFTIANSSGHSQTIANDGADNPLETGLHLLSLPSGGWIRVSRTLGPSAKLVLIERGFLNGGQPLDPDLDTLATAYAPATPTTPARLELNEATDNGGNAIILSGPTVVAGPSMVATFQDVTGTVIVTGGMDLPVPDGGTGASIAADARTNLGVAIGTDVQGFDPLLEDIAALADPGEDRLLGWDDSADTMAWFPVAGPSTSTGALADGVQFLTIDQNNAIDVASIASGSTAHIKTGAGWTGSFTVTFSGVPPSGQEFAISNSSGHDQTILNDGVDNPLETGLHNLVIPNSGWIRVSKSRASSARLVLIARGYLNGGQPLDAELTALASAGSGTNKLPYYPAPEIVALADFSSFSRSLLDDLTPSEARTTLGLAIGTNVQAWDPDLDELAAMSMPASRLASALQPAAPINMTDNVLTRPAFQDYAEVPSSPVITAGALTINIEQGNTALISLDQNLTSLSIINPAASGRAQTVTLILTQNATGGWTINWPSGITWVAGSEPTINPDALSTTIIGLVTVNGGILWHGIAAAEDTAGGGGANALTELTDVTIITPSVGQVLTYDGIEWANQDPTGGGPASDDLARGVTFLPSSQNNLIDVEDIEAGATAHIKTGSSWSGTFTLTFNGVPPVGQEFTITNNSGHPQIIANDGVDNPLEVGLHNLLLPHDASIRVSTAIGTGKLTLISRGGQADAGRFLVTSADVKSSGFTANAGILHQTNTSAAGFTAVFPAGTAAPVGCLVGFHDTAGSWETNALILTCSDGSTIDGYDPVANTYRLNGGNIGVWLRASASSWLFAGQTGLVSSGDGDGIGGPVTVPDDFTASGTANATTFLRGDNTWATPLGAGDVVKVGTPVTNQLGVWTGDGTLRGDTELTWNEIVLAIRNVIITPGSSSGSGAITLPENTTNGTNSISLAAPSNIASSKTINLPDIAGTVLLNLVEDTSPELGAPLVCNGQPIIDYTMPHVAAVSGTLSQTAHGGRPIHLGGNVTVPVASGFTCEIRNKDATTRTIAPASGSLIHNGVKLAALATISLLQYRAVTVVADGTDVWVYGAIS